MPKISPQTRLAIYFIVLALLIVGVVGAQLSGNSQAAQIGSVLATGLGLLFVLVQIILQLRENIQKDKKPSDAVITNALEELNLAENYLKEKQFQYAIEKATNVIQVLPKKGRAYFVRAEAEYGLGRLRSAIEDYGKAIEVEPGYPYNYSGRAQVFREMGEYQLAVQDFAKTLAVSPDLSGTIFQLAHAYYLMGNYETAAKFFRLVLEHPDTSQKELAKEELVRAQNMLELTKNDFSVDAVENLLRSTINSKKNG